MVSERRRARRAQAGGGTAPRGLFDRPADAACLAALRAEPAIAGLTESLVGLSAAQWNITLNRLQECGLMSLAGTRRVGEGADGAPIDAHPLVREYFAKQVRERQPEAWREGHRRLYELLKSSVPYWPEGLGGLQPLYQAVAHGCKAGLHKEVWEEIYRDRIMRGRDSYSVKKLGAFGADLGALACFFEEPWTQFAPGLSETNQASLLNEAAFCLRALGRLTDSLEPIREALQMSVQQGEWLGAARVAINLSELELTLGKVAAAVRDAEETVEFADRSGEWAQRMTNRTTLANALHQGGRTEEALERFREAELLQAKQQPYYPLLYAVQGVQYCELLVRDAERAAWARFLASNLAAADKRQPAFQMSALHEVERRAAQTLKWSREFAGAPVLDLALNHLTLGRVTLYRAVLEGRKSHPARPRGVPETGQIVNLAAARRELTAALDTLRAAGTTHHVPSSLLTCAWLRFLEGDRGGAKADLDESWQIAERGSMKLHMADIHLHRARLFRDRAALAAAAKLIEETGYHRRDEELVDAREALGSPAE